jgi:hypothetical protein
LQGKLLRARLGLMMAVVDGDDQVGRRGIETVDERRAQPITLGEPVGYPEPDPAETDVAQREQLQGRAGCAIGIEITDDENGRIAMREQQLDGCAELIEATDGHQGPEPEVELGGGIQRPALEHLPEHGVQIARPVPGRGRGNDAAPLDRRHARICRPAAGL